MDADKKVISREFISSTLCELGEDDYWKTYSKIIEKALFEGDTEWVEESIDAVAYDSDVQRAIQTSMSSTLNFMLQTVYNNGFNSLLEYREYERNLANAKQSKLAQA